MKTTLSILLCLTFLPAICQIRFEKGYFLDNSGKRTECLIENKDWLNNPETFRYKLNENDNPLKAVINEVSEFGVYEFSKYVRTDVKIDTSRSNLSDISTRREPEWLQKTVFLKTIVEGKANLYSYESKNIKPSFFYTSPNDSVIKQLIYKKYVPDNVTLIENAFFRQQLFNELNCNKASQSHFEKIPYNISGLKKHFLEFNECMGGNVINSERAIVRDILNLKITSGVNYSSFYFRNNLDNSYNVDFDKQLSFRASLEIEYVFPINKNKWSTFIEPTYQYLKGEKNYYNAFTTASINYQSIKFPIGLRHSFFLKNNSKIFLNLIYLPWLNINLGNPYLTYHYASPYYSSTNEIELFIKYSYAVGAGYSTKNFSLEYRYYGKQNITANSLSYYSSYQKNAFILGYRFLKVKSKENKFGRK